MEWMSHRKQREHKQQPSMLPGPAVPGGCLVSFNFLCYILCSRSVCSRRSRLAHFSIYPPESDILQHVAKLPSNKERTAEFLVANKPTFIPTFSGSVLGARVKRRNSLSGGQRNLSRISPVHPAGRRRGVRSLGGGGKNKIIWQSVLFAPPD